jgi:uncharacterized protein YceH (UPF0502 family)
MRLSANECRVLGVLVEKAYTTPAQYPLSLNALTVGSNQKNNRAPVTNLSEDAVFDAVDSLRKKGLAREVMLSGSRVSKFKHEAREGLKVNSEELVLLVDLMLRGPQAAGELRSNASRMHPLESLEHAEALLEKLAVPDEHTGRPLVKKLPPAPGARAPRWVQLLCPGLHPEQAPAGAYAEHEPPRDHSAPAPAVDTAGVRDELAALKQDLAAVRDAVRRLAAEIGAADPFK